MTRARRRSALRILLEAGVAEVKVQLLETADEGPEESAGDQSDGPGTQEEEEAQVGTVDPRSVQLRPVHSDQEPRRLGAYDQEESLLATIPGSAHADAQAVLDTGLALTTVLVVDGSQAMLRITLSVPVAESDG